MFLFYSIGAIPFWNSWEK